MKNLFFALAFMLMGTFAFANNSELESSVVLNDTEMVTTQSNTEMIKSQTIVRLDLCVDIYDVYVDGEYVGTLVVAYEC